MLSDFEKLKHQIENSENWQEAQYHALVYAQTDPETFFDTLGSSEQKQEFYVTTSYGDVSKTFFSK